jgi:chaperonin GroEL (HSP60 family)
MKSVVLSPEEFRNNISQVSQIVAEMFKPCLGPAGMAKLVEDKDGLWFSDDPSIVLSRIGLQHPVAKAISEGVASVSSSIGDGTCTFLILLAELLRGATKLMEKRTHPNTIVDGWKIALDYCLRNSVPLIFDVTDKTALTKVAQSILSDSNYTDTEHIAPLIVEAVMSLSDEETIDLSNFSVEGRIGGMLSESFFVRGIAMPHEVADPLGPKLITDAKIALLKGEINEKKAPSWRAETKVELSSLANMTSLYNARRELLLRSAENVLRSGATVLFVEKGVHPIAIRHLSNKGVMIIRRVVIEGLERISKATGGKVVYDIDALTSADLGYAGLVESRIIGNENWIFVESCENSKAATIVIRGASQTLLHSTIRLVKRSIKTLKAAQRTGKVVIGGGAWEMSMAQQLRNLSKQYEGRQQLAINIFANALEEIPRTLARNAGMDESMTISILRSKHANGNFGAGIDPKSRQIKNMETLGVIDPFSTKQRVLQTAFGVAVMLTRIDFAVVSPELIGEARARKMIEKNAEFERIEKRRKEYGGMEKLDRPILSRNLGV